MCVTLFVLFVAVTARLQCETTLFHVLWKVKTQDNNFLFLFFKFANIWQTEWDEISVLSLKQHNSLFKLRFCSCQVWSVRAIFSSCSKQGTFESEYLQASDKANIWVTRFNPLWVSDITKSSKSLLHFNLFVFASDAFFSLQDIQLVNFGHLIKDGELLIKVSDQPPKKRWEYKVKIFKSKFKSSICYPFSLWGSVLWDNEVKTSYISNSN